MKDIRNYNSKGQLHGHQERYWIGDKVWLKCFFNNGIQIDYEEHYWLNGELQVKIFHI